MTSQMKTSKNFKERVSKFLNSVVRREFQAIVDEAQIDSIIQMERDKDLTKVSSKVAIVKEAFQDLATIAQNQSHIIGTALPTHLRCMSNVWLR